jgi:hypothetical protein
MKNDMLKFIRVMGLAVGLPSTILGLFFVLYEMVKAGYISWTALIVILVSAIVLTLLLMVKYVLVKKD